MEKILAALYAGGWPAKLWGLFPGSTSVRLEQHELTVGREDGRPPLKLAFGSDFHLGPTTHRATLDILAAFVTVGFAQTFLITAGIFGIYVTVGTLVIMQLVALIAHRTSRLGPTPPTLPASDMGASKAL